MTRILDASAFFTDLPAEGVLFTTPSVVSELVDLQSKCRLEAMLASGLTVREPDPRYLAKVLDAAERCGDAGVLSRTDREVLALALELKATVVTDDFAIQNVAHRLSIPIATIRQRSARPIRWRFRCKGCGRYYRQEGECPVCGAEVRRKLK